MKVKARIDRMMSGERVKAIASVSLDGQFVVKGLRVVSGNKGLFVAAPQLSYKANDGGVKYSDFFFPISNAGKTALQEAVLKAYDQKLAEAQEMSEHGACTREESMSMHL